ncbi:hypothetical protein F7725_013847 [Dissostichus mawsoni]|uniref:Large ribosomal subunit protein mL38 n=1 Tax=Dissostichus mawsoni TaxID=36200 RepID=A0A7J5YWQ6_DISMA|nr:hypothetical protein F7725_013847 [Dissostichus mawsoni]
MSVPEEAERPGLVVQQHADASVLRGAGQRLFAAGVPRRDLMRVQLEAPREVVHSHHAPLPLLLPGDGLVGPGLGHLQLPEVLALCEPLEAEHLPGVVEAGRVQRDGVRPGDQVLRPPVLLRETQVTVGCSGVKGQRAAVCRRRRRRYITIEPSLRLADGFLSLILDEAMSHFLPLHQDFNQRGELGVDPGGRLIQTLRTGADLGDLDSTDLESLEKYQQLHPVPEESRGGEEQTGLKVDIGLPYLRPSRLKELKERTQMVKENKKNAELERASRLRTLKVSLDRVQDEWGKSSGPFHIQRLAEHYGVFRDLFPNALFLPQAASVPQISFEAEEGSLWTLMLTCPDEHLLDNEAEYVHWLVGNIPGGSVQEGEELCHYLPPFPPKGTGFHRYVYFLFKQEVRIDFQEDVRTTPLSLAERSFKTLDFYRKHQDAMTPAGLSFFQSQWDESVSNTFHNSLMYHPPQVKHPHRQPLRYLDRYRNGKEHTYGIY